jgi:hypothetical protein
MIASIMTGFRASAQQESQFRSRGRSDTEADELVVLVSGHSIPHYVRS